MPTEIVIADDQEFMRLSFRMVIDSQPDLRVTGEAADGIEAVRLALELRPDVLLMDLRMPHLDGIRAAERLHVLDPAARVLLITTFERAACLAPADAAGAAGVLLKDIPPAGLLAAIREVAAGQPLSWTPIHETVD